MQKPIAVLIFILSCKVQRTHQLNEPYFSCTNRFEFRHELQQRFKGCHQRVKENRLCGENLTVAYSIYPPYVYIDEVKKTVVGILPS